MYDFDNEVIGVKRLSHYLKIPTNNNKPVYVYDFSEMIYLISETKTYDAVLCFMSMKIINPNL
nr:ORF38 [Bracoviriform inaniti]